MSFGVLLFVAVLQQLTYLLKPVSKLFYIYIMYVRRFGSADLSGSYTYSLSSHQARWHYTQTSMCVMIG